MPTAPDRQHHPQIRPRDPYKDGARIGVAEIVIAGAEMARLAWFGKFPAPGSSLRAMGDPSLLMPPAYALCSILSRSISGFCWLPNYGKVQWGTDGQEAPYAWVTGFASGDPCGISLLVDFLADLRGFDHPVMLNFDASAPFPDGTRFSGRTDGWVYERFRESGMKEIPRYLDYFDDHLRGHRIGYFSS